MSYALHTEHLSATDIARAAHLLQEGEIVAFPTETVYGLGACIFLPDAVQKIFQAKGRPSDNPLIAHISNLSQLPRIAQNIPDDFYLLAKAFFPGPLSIILEKTPEVPLSVSAGLHSIAVRMPNHPLALELIEKAGQPLVAPSANLSGKPSSTAFAHVVHDFEGKIAAVIEGSSSEIGIESTVISLLGDTPTILRPGHITQKEIESVLGRSVIMADRDKVSGPVLSPGMKYRHYAPEASVRLFFSEKELLSYLSSSTEGARMILSSSLISGIKQSQHFSLSSQSLYAALRMADEMDFSEVLVFCDDSIVKNRALMNRLQKASLQADVSKEILQ